MNARQTVLVTGITGFVGSHFAEYALAQGVNVWGACRNGSSTKNVDHLEAKLELVRCDLNDADAVRNLVERSRPDYVIHLAGQSFVKASWDEPAATLMTNIGGQVNLLEALRLSSMKPRILVIGSSEEYGHVEEHELPITERNDLRPLSPYAVSKVAQDLMGYQYFKNYGLPVVRSRAFNHDGPRRSDVFVTSSFARQVAEIEAGVREPSIHVGNLNTRRDYTDVRDVVRAYWLLLERGESGEVYNVCSGKTWSVRGVLDFFCREAYVRKISVVEDRARFRPADVPVLVGDFSKIHRAVGWEPEIPFEHTLNDVLGYWRTRVMAVGRQT